LRKTTLKEVGYHQESQKQNTISHTSRQKLLFTGAKSWSPEVPAQSHIHRWIVWPDKDKMPRPQTLKYCPPWNQWCWQYR